MTSATSLSAAAVIPARYGSTRFPGKPLANQTGKFLIQHVYEQVRQVARIKEVVVATDDPRVAEAVRSFGGEAAMTRSDHPSGTDRIAEIAERLDTEIIVNVQGDEPEIEPGTITHLIELLQDHAECPMGTLACPFESITEADPEDPNAVKVAVDEYGFAIDFSRENCWHHPPHPLLHLGIYAYRRDFLLHFVQLQQTQRERRERLEQLRALENGYAIAVGIVNTAFAGIDTPEDYEAFVKRTPKPLNS